MQVEVVALGRLQIALLERFAVPSTITLGHVHVIHVDRNPHVCGGIGYLVIDVLVDKEVVGLRLTILNIIDARLFHTCEVKLHVVILKVWSPRLDLSLVGFNRSAVGVDTHQTGYACLYRVILVKLNDGHLRLLRNVAYLRETDVRLANPVRNGMWLDGPRHNLACLALWQNAAHHEPAVLCQHTAVEELQLGIVARNGDEA